MFSTAPRTEDRVPLSTQRARDAQVSGRPITDCPYALGSVESINWIREWVIEEEEDEQAIHALIQERGRLGK